MLRERQTLPNLHIVRQPRLRREAKVMLDAAGLAVQRYGGEQAFRARRELGVTVFSWQHLLRLNPDPWANLTDVQIAIYNDLPDSKHEQVEATIHPAKVYKNSSRTHIGYPVRASYLDTEHQSIRETCERYGLAVPRQPYEDFHLSIGSFALGNQALNEDAIDVSIKIANYALEAVPNTIALGTLAIHAGPTNP